MAEKRPGDEVPGKGHKAGQLGSGRLVPQTQKVRSKARAWLLKGKRMFGDKLVGRVVDVPHVSTGTTSGRSPQAHRATAFQEVEAKGLAMVQVMMPKIELEYPIGTWVAFNVDRGGFVTAETQLELVEKFEAQFGRDRGWFDEVGRRKKKTAERHR